MKSKNVYRILKPIAKLFVKLGVKYPDVANLFEKAFVFEAEKISKKKTKVEISARTGIDRRTVSDHLNGEELYTPPDKLNLISRELEKITNKGSIDIPKKGRDSLESILIGNANGRLTLDSVIDELERTGRIKVIDEKVRFLTTILDGGITRDKLSQLLGDSFSFVCETAQYSQTINENKLMYWWDYSKQISPNDSIEASKAIYEQCVRHRKENFKLLETFETTRFEKYPSIGVMQTQFDFNYYE